MLRSLIETQPRFGFVGFLCLRLMEPKTSGRGGEKASVDLNWRAGSPTRRKSLAKFVCLAAQPLHSPHDSVAILVP